MIFNSFTTKLINVYPSKFWYDIYVYNYVDEKKFLNIFLYKNFKLQRDKPKGKLKRLEILIGSFKCILNFESIRNHIKYSNYNYTFKLYTNLKS